METPRDGHSKEEEVTTSAEMPTLLDHCPTHTVCPPCREGWGHWNGTEYVPTIESEAAQARQRTALALDKIGRM